MIEELLAYQVKDADLKKIEDELGNSEERKKYAVAKKYLSGVDENLNKLELRAAELTAAFEKAVATQKDYEEQGAEISQAAESAEDSAELQYLIKKADELSAKIKTIADTANRINKELQAVLGEFSKLRATTKAAQEQYKEYGEKYAELKKKRAAEMDSVKKELDALREKVDSKLMEMYDKKRVEKIYPVFYESKGKSCGFCNMELSMAAIDKLKNGEIIECEQCHRLLFSADKK